MDESKLKLKDGLPTGHFNASTGMAEVNCYIEEVEEGTSLVRRIPCGTRWIPMTDEMRRQMQGCVVSMPTVAPTLVDSILAEEPSPLQEPGNSDCALYVAEQVALSLEEAVPMVEEPLVRAVEDGYTSATLTVEGVDRDRVTSPSAGVTRSMATVLAESAPVAEQYKEQRHGDADRRAFKEENSGGNVNYYCVPIDRPKRPERAPYVFEVEDLVEALNMTFHEGTVLKSLVRSCVERELGMKKVGGDYIRDAEKMVHSSAETLRIRRIRAEKGLK